MAEEKENKEKQSITVNTLSGAASLFSHGAIVNVSDYDATFEFIFISPSAKVGSIVSRITMPIPVAEAFANNILNTVKQKKEQKAKKDE